MNVALAAILVLGTGHQEPSSVERAIATCRTFASRCDMPLPGLTAAFTSPPESDHDATNFVQFGAYQFQVDGPSGEVTRFTHEDRLTERRKRKRGENPRGDLGQEASLRRLRELAGLLADGGRFEVRHEAYYPDDPPIGTAIPGNEHEINATAFARYRPLAADMRPMFCVAGSFSVILDAHDLALLDYSAYPRGEVTSDEDRTGEAAARRTSVAVALEHYGAGPEGSTMELGYSEPRPRSPGATFQGRGGKPTELRLAWRFMIEKFSYQGRYVDLCIDVDAATGQVLWTNPRPRDPRLDR